MITNEEDKEADVDYLKILSLYLELPNTKQEFQLLHCKTYQLCE
jgi:hypothetical protein